MCERVIDEIVYLHPFVPTIIPPFQPKFWRERERRKRKKERERVCVRKRERDEIVLPL